jgi:adenylate cyclase
VAELLSSRDGEQLLAGHRAYISCLFCDLRDFTAFAVTAAPEELFDVLREYHAALGELIPAHKGTLEHFAGDGVMVFFNDPLAVADHELQAVRFALTAQERFAQLAGVWRKRWVAANSSSVNSGAHHARNLSQLSSKVGNGTRGR